MAEANGTKLHPIWREVAEHFTDNYNYGDLVPREWLYESFGIEMPADDTPNAVAEKARLKFVGQFEALRHHLLETFQMDLVCVVGKGYRISLPAEQTETAIKEGLKDIASGLSKMAGRILHTNTSMLTDEQKRQNADSLAKLGMLAQLHKSARRELMGRPAIGSS